MELQARCNNRTGVNCRLVPTTFRAISIVNGSNASILDSLTIRWLSTSVWGTFHPVALDAYFILHADSLFNLLTEDEFTHRADILWHQTKQIYLPRELMRYYWSRREKYNTIYVVCSTSGGIELSYSQSLLTSVEESSEKQSRTTTPQV